MEKREIDEQLKSLSFDMDEEIDDRNERRGKGRPPLRYTSQSVKCQFSLQICRLNSSRRVSVLFRDSPFERRYIGLSPQPTSLRQL